MRRERWTEEAIVKQKWKILKIPCPCCKKCLVENAKGLIGAENCHFLNGAQGAEYHRLNIYVPSQLVPPNYHF